MRGSRRGCGDGWMQYGGILKHFVFIISRDFICILAGLPALTIFMCVVLILYFLFSFRVAFFGIFSNFLGSVELNLAVLLHCSKYLVELSRLGWCRKPVSSLVDDGPAVAEMF